MKTKTIQFKLISRFALLMLLSTIIIVFSIFSMEQSKKMMNTLNEARVAGFKEISTISQDYSKMRVEFYKMYLYRKDSSFVADPNNNEINLAEKEVLFNNALNSFKNSYTNIVGGPGKVGTVERYRTILDKSKVLFPNEDFSKSEENLSSLTSSIINNYVGIIDVVAFDYPDFSKLVYEFEEPLDELSTKIDILFNEVYNRIDTTVLNFNKQKDILIIVIASLFGILILLTVILIYFVVVDISRPLKQLVYDAKVVGTGVLEFQSKYHRGDEINELAEVFEDIIGNLRIQVEYLDKISTGDLTSVNKDYKTTDTLSRTIHNMYLSLNNIFKNITQSSEQMDAASIRASKDATSLASGSTEQASAVEELSTTLSRVSQTIKENASSSSTASKNVELIKENALFASKNMAEVQEVSKAINNSSIDVKKISELINDIAFRTNILSLNASIEAANAGVHGKVFAVLAEEIRTLSLQTQEAAKQTQDIISDSINLSKQSVVLVDKAADSLTDITNKIKSSSEIINFIAKTSDEQSDAISQINEGIKQVAQVVSQNSLLSEQYASASEEMSIQAKQLKELVSNFKLAADEEE